MSVKKQDCYLLECDGCGKDLRAKVYCESCTTPELHARSLDHREVRALPEGAAR